MKIVTKEEFVNFLKSYPHPLERDWYMEWFSWNDFSNEKVWPESMVAMCSDGSYDDPIIYKIMEEDKE